MAVRLKPPVLELGARRLLARKFDAEGDKAVGVGAAANLRSRLATLGDADRRLSDSASGTATAAKAKSSCDGDSGQTPSLRRNVPKKSCASP